MNNYIFDVLYGASFAPEYIEKWFYIPSLSLNKKEKLSCLLLFLFRWSMLILCILFFLCITTFFLSNFISPYIIGFLTAEILVLIWLINEEELSLKEILIEKEYNKNKWYRDYWLKEYYRSNNFQYYGEVKC